MTGHESVSDVKVKNHMNLQAAYMSCRAMFQKVDLRALEIKLRLDVETGDPGDCIWKGIMRSWEWTRRDLAPLRCLAHSDIEASRNSYTQSIADAARISSVPDLVEALLDVLRRFIGCTRSPLCWRNSQSESSGVIVASDFKA